MNHTESKVYTDHHGDSSLPPFGMKKHFTGTKLTFTLNCVNKILKSKVLSLIRLMKS